MLCLMTEEGGKAWVDVLKEERSYIQCLSCGKIYIVGRKLPIGASVVRSECPRCKHDKGLHCGYNDMDVMELKDWTLDERYFNY